MDAKSHFSCRTEISVQALENNTITDLLGVAKKVFRCSLTQKAVRKRTLNYAARTASGSKNDTDLAHHFANFDKMVPYPSVVHSAPQSNLASPGF
jgi:hypothetical protein